MNNKFDKKAGLEELKRTLLMMKYDTSKTLTENVSKVNNVLLEQSNNTSNVITDADILGDTGYIRSFFQLNSDFSALGLPNLYDIIGINLPNLIADRRAGVKGCVDALDGFVDAKDLAYVLTVISSLAGKCYLDDSQSPAVLTPAINRFLELYTEDENEDLISVVQNVGTQTLPTGSEKIKKQIINKIQELKTTPCSTTKQQPQQTTVPPCIDTSEFEKQKRPDGNYQWLHKESGFYFFANYWCYDPKTKKSGTYKCGESTTGVKMTESRYSIKEQSTTIGNISISWDAPSGAKTNVAKPTYTVPKELTGKVKQFQDWLDRNHPGWHKKYGTLRQDVQKGYGKFGPNSNRAWGLYGKDFLAGKEEPTQPTGPSVQQQTQNNQQAPASPATPEQAPQVTPERQQEIISNLKKRGIDGAYIYKGDELLPNELNFITNYINKQEKIQTNENIKGYQKTKEINKDYGKKYVFQK